MTVEPRGAQTLVMKLFALLALVVLGLFLAFMAVLRFVPDVDQRAGTGSRTTWGDGRVDYTPSPLVGLSWKLFGIPKAERVKLTVTVVDSENQPMKGAQVSAKTARASRSFTVNADADGVARLKLPEVFEGAETTLQVGAMDYDHVPLTMKVAAGVDHATAVLRRTYHFRSRVLDERGEPVAGVRFSSEHAFSPHPTDREGKVELFGFPPGIAWLRHVPAEREEDAVRIDLLPVELPQRFGAAIRAQRTGAKVRVVLSAEPPGNAWCWLEQDGEHSPRAEPAWADASSATFLFVALEPGPWWLSWRGPAEAHQTVHRMRITVKAGEQVVIRPSATQ